MSSINLPLADLKLRHDHEHHMAMEFYRGEKWSEYVALSPEGPQKFREPAVKFDNRFIHEDSAIPLRMGSLSFLRAAHRAYLPGDGIFEILMEVYIMAATTGKELTKMTADELLEVYNELASIVGKPKLNSFKNGKMILVAKIGELKELAGQPTKEQAEAKAVKLASAEKRLEKIVAADERKTKAKNKDAPGKPVPVKAPKKVAAKPAVKPAAKPAAKPAVKAKPVSDKPKKKGIGAFCEALILKKKSNEEVLEAVGKEFPDASTSDSSISWYRNKLRKEGKL